VERVREVGAVKRDVFLQLLGAMMSGVAVPPKKRASVIDRHTTLVGFDTEYDPITRELLSVQLSVKVGDALVSKVFDAPAPKIRRGDLLEMACVFLAEQGIEVETWRGVKRIAFICHTAWAELSVFADPFYQFDISEMGRGHLATATHQRLSDEAWRIWIIDLFSFFSVKLEAIGAAIGLPKVNLDASRIHIIKMEDPALFAAYAARDAEIALEAFVRLRGLLLEQWGVDPLNHLTPASVGGEIFKRHFFRSAAAPFRKEYEATQRQRKDGAWAPARRAYNVYAGEPGVRHLSIRTLHGGRNEAFIRGFYPNPVEERDVRSMYPTAARSMGLPNDQTKWLQVADVAQLTGMEGFAHACFEFPPGTDRPCLPVRLSEDTQLYPQTGETYATFAEFRLALRLGASINIISAFGFVPGERELDHELGHYLAALVQAKDKAPRGSLERQFYKDLLNQPLGKLGQKSMDLDFLAVERHAQAWGHEGLAASLAQDASMRSTLRGVASVGSLWSPEQLGLILGKARALIGEILIVSRAYSVSTDSVIIDAGASIACPAYEELLAVGSDMPVEVAADALFIGRARQYALLTRADRATGDLAPVARNETFAVVKIARHGSRESQAQFGETVLRCIAAGENVAPVRQVTSFIKPQAAAMTGRAIGEAEIKERKTQFNWDKKRVLVDRDCNPFRSFTLTRPYQSRNRREGGERAARVRSGASRRSPRTLTDSKRAAVLALLAEGLPLREVARRVDLAPSTVASVRDQAKASKETHMLGSGVVARRTT
jgi:hypothetical protein